MLGPIHKTLTLKQIKSKLKSHEKWLAGESGGKQAVFSNRKLEGLSLKGANLNRANFDHSVLINVDLSGALLNKACCHETKFYNVNFSNASCFDIDLYCAELFDCILSYTYMTFANLTRASLKNCAVCSIDLTSANLSQTDLRGTGILRIVTDYEVTICPGKNGPILHYGCERHPISYWKKNIKKIVEDKEIWLDLREQRIKEIKTIIALYSAQVKTIGRI